MPAAQTPAAHLFDVLIVGGGPAGLSAAIGLARQLYSAVVFDNGVYRNAGSKHMHNVATWDHVNPMEFRKKAREDIQARYNTIKFENTTVDTLYKTPKGIFEATDIRGNVWAGRKVILASGVKDIFPEIEGYGDAWIKGIFHCLFCHGYEERGASHAGVLAIGDLGNVMGGPHMARMARRLAGDVTIYTDGNEELAEQLRKTLENDQNISIDNRQIRRLTKGAKAAEVDITFADGETVTEGFIAHKPKTEVNGPFARTLGIDLNEQGDIKSNQPFFDTSTPGVWAIGDCATWLKGVTNAVSMGSTAAAAVAGVLQSEPVPHL